MRRRRTDPLMQKLRLLARDKRRLEALQLLQETLRQTPSHAQAREELNRHLTGRPYSFEEKAHTELQKLLTDYITSPTMLTAASCGALQKMRKRQHFLQLEIQHILTESESKTLHQFNQSLAREVKRRRSRMRKPLGIAAAVLLLALGLGGSYHYLNIQADNAASVLYSAGGCETTSIAAATRLLAVHDTGLNRTLNRNIGAAAERLRAHIRAAEQRARELDAILRSIETGQQSVVGQGVRRRAEIERMLKLPCSNESALRQRWAALCQKESEALKQQRLALAREILSPLPEPVPLCGEVNKDIEATRQRLNTLQKRLLLFEDAGETAGVSADAMEPVRKELAELSHLLQGMQDFQLMLRLLPAAHDYASYRSRLAETKAQHYAPALRILSILNDMPAEDSVRGMMQEHGQNLRPGLLQASRQCLLEGGPSFSQDFPATREQLHLLNELLTNKALSTRLYELTDTAEHQQAYSETLPELRHGRACFERSALDPARQAAQNKKEEWHNPHAILSREIDPRPLHTGLGLDKRSGFFSSVNLPELLTRIFQIEGARIPALARAYVFYHLVKANAATAEPILTGLRFAPAMRDRIQEFEELRKECGIELNGSCWLQNTPKHAAAERKLAHWFNKHQTCDFTDELKRNLGTLLRVAPRFSGYVNEQGAAVLFEQVTDGQLIWYMGEDSAIIATPWGVPLQSPRHLSPIFTVERQF